LIEIPDRLWLELDDLGQATVYDDNRSNDTTDLYRNLKTKGNYAIKEALLVSKDLMYEIIKQYYDLKESAELSNNRLKSLDVNDTE